MYGGGRGVVNVMFVRRYSVWRWAWCSEHVCEEVQCMGEGVVYECDVCEEVQCMEEGVV